MDDLLNFFKNLSHVKDFDRIRIGLASPEKIRSWSYGEIKTPETINYRSFKPEHEGLFCARTFGPIKDYECLCGKYKLFKHQGIVCEKCGVEVTKASVRRERLGHIELAAPIAHIWHFKSLPSRIGLLLDMSLRDLERVLYFEMYVVIEPGSTSLKRGQLLSEVAYLEALETFGQDFDARMGGEAIYELLRSLDLALEVEKLRVLISTCQSESVRKKLGKRLLLFQAFLRSGNKPEWMVLRVLPVLPPSLRPLVPSEGMGRFVCSDLNELYRRVITRNNRSKRLLALKAPGVVIRNELRMLQESVDALLDNGRQHRVVSGANRQPLQSLSDMIKGKQGRFRQNLLGKRVDFSGRSVIVVDPCLKLHQCGFPKIMALELFKPFLLFELQKRGLAISIQAARLLVEDRVAEVWEVLEDVVVDFPVLLNRIPTLCRLGIQAFEPVLVDDLAIHLHPLVCRAFNAKFEGDQMAVHVPLSLEAQVEARVLLMSGVNIFSPVNGEPLFVPSQEMIVGLFFLTREGMGGEGLVFADVAEVERAFVNRVVGLQASVVVRVGGVRVNTTVGRAFLSQSLPVGFPFELINCCLTRERLLGLLGFCFRRFGLEETIRFAESLMHFGFVFATRSGLSLGFDDLEVPEDKSGLIGEAMACVEEVEEQYRCGLISGRQRYGHVVDIWAQTRDKIADAVLSQLSVNTQVFKEGVLEKAESVLYMMLKSGVCRLGEIREIVGMCGLRVKADGSFFENPVTASLCDGLGVFEYFFSSHNMRRRMAILAVKTANAGYLTRRLVDVAQDVVVVEDDCGTSEGLCLTALVRGGKVVVSLGERVVGRVVAEDVFVEGESQPFVKAGSFLDEDWVELLEDKGVVEVKVRSPITCESEGGVCALCYGRDLGRGVLVDVGEAVGVIAAQSVGQSVGEVTRFRGEFGGAGVVEFVEVGCSGVLVFEGVRLVLQRLKSGVSLGFQFVNVSDSGVVCVVDGSGGVCERHRVPYGAIFLVNDGAVVEAGMQVAYWYSEVCPVISEVAGFIRFVDMVEGVTVVRELDDGNGRISYQVRSRSLWPLGSGELRPGVKVVDKDNKALRFAGSKAVVSLPAGAVVNVDNGVRVDVGDVVAFVPRGGGEFGSSGLGRLVDLFEARVPKAPAIFALRAGQVSFGKESKVKHRFVITGDDGSSEVFTIPKWRDVRVASGNEVEVGDVIVEGSPNLHDILRLRGVGGLVRYFVDELQEIFINHNVSISCKHFEVIIRQMLGSVIVVDPGDTPFFCGEVVSESRLLAENEKLVKGKGRSGKAATWERHLLGITKASLATDSFISAASFMDTTRVLLNSALKGSCDDLRGIKENVILGRLIPAGTGFHEDRR